MILEYDLGNYRVSEELGNKQILIDLFILNETRQHGLQYNPKYHIFLADQR